MLKIIVLMALSARVSIVQALPKPADTPAGHAFSLEMTKRSFETVDINGFDLEKRAGSLTASSTVSTLTEYNDRYTVQIQVGGQTLPIVVDTGSQDFWMESNALPAAMTGSNHPLYTPGSSATQIQGWTFTAGFDSSASPVAKGIAYADKVAIGSATVVNQILGAATSVSPASDGSYNNLYKSGIMGLAYSKKQFNFVDGNGQAASPACFAQNILSSLAAPLFTLDLRNDNTGSLDFGFIDANKYSGSIAYSSCDPRWANWFIPVNAYYINNVKQMNSSAPAGTPQNISATRLAHPDSGAPFMRFPSWVVNSYYSQVSGYVQNGDAPTFPCSSVGTSNLPPFGIEVGGTVFNVPSQYMWYRKLNGNKSSTTCEGALRALGNDKDNAQIGDMFLRTVFAVYDFNNGAGRVGFAAKKNALPARTP